MEGESSATLPGVRRNRWPGDCAGCGVHICSGAGFLADDPAQGSAGPRMPWCPTCHVLIQLDYSDRADRIPDQAPPGCAPTVRLHVYGVTILCRACGEGVLVPVGLYPARPPRGYCGLHLCLSPAVRRLFIEVYSSDTTEFIVTPTVISGRPRVPNGRCACGVMNSLHVEKHLMDVVASHGFNGLALLAVASAPTAVWQRIVHAGDACLVGSGF